MRMARLTLRWLERLRTRIASPSFKNAPNSPTVNIWKHWQNARRPRTLRWRRIMPPNTPALVALCSAAQAATRRNAHALVLDSLRSACRMLPIGRQAMESLKLDKRLNGGRLSDGFPCAHYAGSMQRG